MIRNLIWDVDGTLLDTYPAMARAFGSVLAEAGHPVAPERVEALVKVSIGRRALAAECGLEAEDLLARFWVCYGAMPLDGQGPFAGARALCEHAHAAGGLNVIVTHRRRETLLRLLAAHDLDRYFADMATGDDGYAPKPDPEAFLAVMGRNGLPPEETLTIGDREIDILGGRAAGVRTCFFGPPPYETAADYAVSDLRELLRILRARGICTPCPRSTR